MKPFDAALERHDERVGGRERIVQQRLGLIREEADVGRGRARPPSPRARGAWSRRRRSAIVSRSRRPQPVGRLDQHLEVLRQADIARVHHHEPIDESVRAREGVVLRPGHDRLAVGPVVDDVHARRIGALFLDQPAAHAIAERDDRVGLAEQIPVDAIERRVHRAALEILEQRRDLRKDVLAEIHEARAGAPRGPAARRARQSADRSARRRRRADRRRSSPTVAAAK